MTFYENMTELLFSDGILSAVKVTFIMAFCSTGISAIIGIWFGLFLERHEFRGKKIVIRVNRTLMGVPPVVVGLVVYMLIMNKGPLGFLGLLFTIEGMILAQTFIITPIIAGMTYASAIRVAPQVRYFGKCIGASERDTKILIRKELKKELYFSIVTGFGRAISEVGAVMMIGGNMLNQTRTMTTAISLLKSQGIFTQGIILGTILLIMAFILQWVADVLQREKVQIDNF